MIEIGLLYPDKESEISKGYGMAGDMMKDLNLSVILSAMADRDEFLYAACRSVILNPIQKENVLKFRQEMVMDAVAHMDFYEGAYDLAAKAMESIEKNQEKKERDRSKTQQIYDALQILLVLVSYLEKLKNHVRTEESEGSLGMRRFVERLRNYYSDDFAQELRSVVENTAFLMNGGRLVMTAGVGNGMKAGNAVINRLEPVDYRQMGRLRRMLRYVTLRFFSPEAIFLKDAAARQEALQMEANGLHYTLQAYRKFIREFQDFFEQFRTQIGFYVGCSRLYKKLSHLHMKVCYPRVSGERGRLDYRNLYELAMALVTLKNPVPNTLMDACCLHVISGANQGGKSTFLRSVGIAQVLMQAGMFVPADYFVSSLYDDILTHFTRREDYSMNSGRLMEEMRRMDRIVDMVTDASLILMNESFSSTTEKEGSWIAMDIIRALYDIGVSVFMVTHLFAFADGLYHKKLPAARFMSAERKESGARTYKMIDHAPTETSYGLDLYEEIIEKEETDCRQDSAARASGVNGGEM